MDESEKSGATSRKLANAVRAVKIAAADRGDVATETSEAERARLELLAQELQPVFDDVPLDDPQWDFALSSGLQPRLWIDATSHVMMGRDRRTYRFVRDTRLGRIIVAESTNSGKIADAVTFYIAERMVERARLLEGEPIPIRKPVAEGGEQGAAEAESSAMVSDPPRQSASRFTWFLFGGLVACIVLFALFHDRIEQVLFQ